MAEDLHSNEPPLPVFRQVNTNAEAAALQRRLNSHHSASDFLLKLSQGVSDWRCQLGRNGAGQFCCICTGVCAPAGSHALPCSSVTRAASRDSADGTKALSSSVSVQNPSELLISNSSPAGLPAGTTPTFPRWLMWCGFTSRLSALLASVGREVERRSRRDATGRLTVMNVFFTVISSSSSVPARSSATVLFTCILAQSASDVQIRTPT